MGSEVPLLLEMLEDEASDAELVLEWTSDSVRDSVSVRLILPVEVPEDEDTDTDVVSKFETSVASFDLESVVLV